MSYKIIVSPLKKEIEQLPSYKKLLSLNRERMEKIMGTDEDWLIKIPDQSNKPNLDAKLKELHAYVEEIMEYQFQ